MNFCSINEKRNDMAEAVPRKGDGLCLLYRGTEPRDGGEKFPFYTTLWVWPFIILFFNIWKGVGYRAVMYLEAISLFQLVFCFITVMTGFFLAGCGSSGTGSSSPGTTGAGADASENTSEEVAGRKVWETGKRLRLRKNRIAENCRFQTKL